MQRILVTVLGLALAFPLAGYARRNKSQMLATTRFDTTSQAARWPEAERLELEESKT